MGNTPATPLKTGGLSANALKTIAILAMVVDHCAYAFLPDYYGFPALPLHMLGRITGPVIFFFVAEGYHHTRDKNRYTLRMGLFALLSYLPFFWFSQGFGSPTAQNWMHFGVIYTLFLGLLALRARHEIPFPPLQVVAIGLCLTASAFGDWAFFAILYILMFDAFRGSFRNQAWGFTFITLAQLANPFMALVRSLLYSDWASAAINRGYLLYYGAFFLPLLLLRFYNGQRGRGGGAGKWFFYLFYPAHLLVIVAIRFFTGANI